LRVGDRSLIGARVCYDRVGASVSIGERTFIGKSTIVTAERVTIGDDVLISWGVTIVDHDSHSLDWTLRANDMLDWAEGRKDWTHIPIAPVLVGDKAFIGFGVSILKGVTIGEGAVVGARSIVTRDVAPWTLVAGNPARFLKNLPRGT
jgi:galactoside O-acetyltransferase